MLNGFHHVALITDDATRLHSFFVRVFDATVERDDPVPGGRLSFISIGEHTEFNVFELHDNPESQRNTPMFGRGRLDHFGLLARDKAAFDEIRRRLMADNATDGFVTDFGPVLSVFFRTPDGLECEVCVPNPDAVPGQFNQPGTAAAGY